MSTTSPATLPERTFFGHPRGLATLFLTEMWERFSFYGMRGILILFLVAPATQEGLGMHEGTAKALLGVYMAMVYFVALPGGWIADRILGARRAVLYGGVVIALGHYAMAIPGTAFVWIGLILIICGTGLLKPNVATIVGGLYRDADDARRDAGFSVFYMGVNLGAFFAPLVTGYLGEKVNWHLGFGAAAIGMTLALVQYILGGKYLGDVGIVPEHRLTAAERRRFGTLVGVGAAVVVAVLAIAAPLGWLTLDNVTIVLTVLAIAVPIGYFAFLFFGSHGLAADERLRLRAYVWLWLAAALFWMIYDQAAGPLNLFADRNTNRHVLGWEVPASWAQSINPILVIALSPVFAWLWMRLGNRVSTPLKFAFALVMCGLSFVVMSGAAAAASGGIKISIGWLVVVYLIQVLGELALSPVGLSVTAKLAPHAFVSQMMGVWFLATALGDALGGQVARLQPRLGEPRYFLVLGVLTVLAGIAFTMFVRKLRHLMNEGAPVQAS